MCFGDAQCKLFRIVSIEFSIGLLIPLLPDVNCRSMIFLPLPPVFIPLFIFHLLLISLSSLYLLLFGLYLPLPLFPWFCFFLNVFCVVLHIHKLITSFGKFSFSSVAKITDQSCVIIYELYVSVSGHIITTLQSNALIINSLLAFCFF